MHNPLTSKHTVSVANFKTEIWLLGIACWLFGITDRSIASFSDRYLSSTDSIELFIASFFFISWLFLKPKQSFSKGNIHG